MKEELTDGLYLLNKEKEVLSHEAAWDIYRKAETAEQKAKRGAICQAMYFADESVKNSPNNDAVQAKYLAAKQAWDEQEEADNQALKLLGWVEVVEVAA